MALDHTSKLATGGITSIQSATVGEIGSGTSWSEPFYTLKDSITVSQAEPTKTEIKVDQIASPIYANYEAGAFTVSGSIPDLASAVLSTLYTNTTAPYAPNGKTAVGIKTTVKVVNKMWRLNFASGQSLIITNGDLVASLEGQNLSTTAMGHKFTISAKAGVASYNQGADVVVWNLV